jgi:zinc protease
MKTVNRSFRPMPAPDNSFIIPKTENFLLDNGIPVYFIEKKDLPIVRLNLGIFSGSKMDLIGKRGTANLVSMMIDEGAGDYNAFELSDEFDNLGTSFSIRCYNDLFYFSLQSIKENFLKSLSLFKSVLLKPHFNEEDFVREKKKILTRLLQINDDPEEIADISFERKVFHHDNPYANPVIGYRDEVEIISLEDVVDFYRNYFIPANSFFIVVGATSIEEIKSRLNELVEDWKPGELLNSPAILNLSDQKGVFVIDKEGAVQSEIRTGYLSPLRHSNGYFPKKVFNTIFGGQFSSRINLNLREVKGYTYGAFSRYVYYMNSAYFYISTSVGKENTGNALIEIFKELDKIKKGIHPEELAFAQSSLMRKFPASFETFSQLASNIKGQVVHDLPNDYFENYIHNVKSVTIDDVDQAVQSVADRKDLITVIVGNKKKILKQLLKLNIKDVQEIKF